MREIRTKLDALSFLYNFEKYAEKESNGSFLFIFPYELSGGDIDLFHIYKDGVRWAVFDEEVSPGTYGVRYVNLRELVNYVYGLREQVNDGIRECV